MGNPGKRLAQGIPTRPTLIAVVGWTWITYGCLISVYCFSLIYHVADMVVKGNRVFGFPSLLIELAAFFISGATFVRWGLQIITGAITDTRGMSLAALAMGVISLGSFILFAFYGIFVYVLLTGFPLIVAGILAELRRRQYLAWREARNANPPATKG